MNIIDRLAFVEDYPLDFTLQYPPRREYFQGAFRQPMDVSALKREKELLLYVHVPFCQAKCYFCNFAVDIRNTPELHVRYTKALCEQLRRLDAFLPDDVRINGIDIGGGTPTMLDAPCLAQILAALKPWLARSSCHNPLSIETTPRIAAEHPERLQVLAQGGVTRVSMGIQSFNAATLASLNRGLQEDMTEKAVRHLQQTGFERLNADIIFGLPQQTVQDWRHTVERVIDLGFDSITTYDCLYRGKGRAMTKRTRTTPTPETYGALYDAAYELLLKAGFYAPYGSVNFSRHAGETGTSPYFEGRLFHHTPYIGTGNYASSMMGDYWWFAPYGVNEWLRRIEAGDILPQGDSYRLPKGELMAKQVLLSLNFGVIDDEKFQHRFGLGLEDVYGDALNYAVKQGWMERRADGFGVVEGRFQFMPQIRSLFYTDQALDWLATWSSSAETATQVRG